MKQAVIRTVLAILFATGFGWFWGLPGIIGGVAVANIVYCIALLVSVPRICGLDAVVISKRWVAAIATALALGFVMPNLVEFSVNTGYIGWFVNSASTGLICLPVALAVFIIVEFYVYKDIWFSKIKPLLQKFISKA
jgi:hypothetical protein